VAYEGDLHVIPGLVASADLSADQFKIVKLDSNGKVALCTTLGGDHDGVLQNKPAAADRAASVGHLGVSKVLLGATVNAGANVSCRADSTGGPAASTHIVLGKAMEAGVAGDIVSVLLTKWVNP
jgi:hypothetical protein